MKKRSLALRLFLYASLVSLVWLGGYVILSEVFAVPEVVSGKEPEQVTPVADVPMTVSGQWSVLVVTDEEREVTKFFFRYADYLSDGMVFVEVPVNTKAELPAGGYEMLSVHNPELPELFMISDMCRIFSEETWCMAAEEVGVALLGVRPKECYVIEKTVYEELTETVDGQVRFQIPKSMKDTIVAVTKQAITDDTLREELLYVESYLDMKEIVYRTLPGEALAEEYRPEFGGIRQMLEQLQMGVFTTEDERL